MPDIGVGQVGFTEPHHFPATDRKSTRLNSSHLVISYAVFCLKKKKQIAGAASYSCCQVATERACRAPGCHPYQEPQSSEAIRSAPICSEHLFFFNDTATTEIYTLSLHDALPI